MIPRGLSLLLLPVIAAFSRLLRPRVRPRPHPRRIRKSRFAKECIPHNDYQQRHPLYDALDEGLYNSVEADIWLEHGKVLISHLGFSFKGSLEDLYLRPLQERVDRLDSVYGDDRPFILWIDIKQSHEALEKAFSKILAKYPMLTEFTDQGVRPGAVTVILTGDVAPKTEYTNHTALRYACRDSKIYNDRDPHADLRWQWYSLKWSSWMKDSSKLAVLVSRIHRKGRKVRLWDVPTSETIWRAAFNAQTDLVGADDLPRMRRFVDSLANSNIDQTTRAG